MTATTRDDQVTTRLRDWVDLHYAGRGKFTQLHSDSLIPAQRWKDMYYSRQRATIEMLDFVGTVSTRDRTWIETGIKPPQKTRYPFGTQPPTEDDRNSLQGRLIWTIRHWASPTGAALFEYLEEKSEKRIPANDWAKMILRQAPPTIAMVELVCRQQHQFAAWIVTGWNPVGVDPANEDSIKHYERHLTRQLNSLAKSVTRDAPAKQRAKTSGKPNVDQ